MKNLDYPISLNNLNWDFGDTQILKNISTNIDKNRFTCIIGPNGSGKSTLLKNILKILEPQENSVFIYNKDILDYKYKDLSKKIASVPQNTMIDFEFSVMDIVLMGRSPYLGRFEVEGEVDFQIARRSMEMTDTWYLRERSINTLSGGERQRVIIARALAQQSNILVLDEPISNLDMQHQINILNITKELSEKQNITILAVLHDLNLAIQYSQYLILMNKGEIVDEGLPEEVITYDNIKRVYDIDIHIMNNPITGKPHIIPIAK
ncbi:MAG: ABC transporter ATP-binding protein [Maledivibacter sp.]|nr:ABC transporter ATP-binding protein [Maledivibacter sp.]